MFLWLARSARCQSRQEVKQNAFDSVHSCASGCGRKHMEPVHCVSLLGKLDPDSCETSLGRLFRNAAVKDSVITELLSLLATRLQQRSPLLIIHSPRFAQQPSPSSLTIDKVSSPSINRTPRDRALLDRASLAVIWIENTGRLHTAYNARLFFWRGVTSNFRWRADNRAKFPGVAELPSVVFVPA